MFPKRRADGTFCVEVEIALSPESGVENGGVIQNWWSTEWMQKNERWIRIWNEGHATERREVLLFEDDFCGFPQVVSCDGSRLRFRLVGKSSGKWWRDWLVSRIIPDLRIRFPGMGELNGVWDCNDAGPGKS
jgi:hypothetical protein